MNNNKKYKFLTIIPLAGKASRFVDYGIETPKQMLPFRDGSLPLIRSLNSIKNLNDSLVIFILKENDQERLISIAVKKLLPKLNFITIVVGKTDSPVHTLDIALNNKIFEQYSNLPSVIHTMDIEIPDKVTIPVNENVFYVFKAHQGPYSYVELDENDFITRCAEKIPISGTSNTGIYVIKKTSELISVINNGVMSSKKGELSIAETLVLSLNKIKAHHVKNIYIFGTPQEWLYYNNTIMKLMQAQKNKNIVLLADHSGEEQCEKISKVLRRGKWNVKVLGNQKLLSWDKIVDNHKQKIRDIYFKENSFVIAICKSGVGVANALTKVLGTYCPVIQSDDNLKLVIEHSCMRAFSLSAESLDGGLIKYKNIEKMLLTYNEGGRHQRRALNHMTTLDNQDNTIKNIKEYRDWFIGPFSQTLIDTMNFEVGFKSFPDGVSVPDKHFHSSGIEITFISKGGGKHGNKRTKKGDILIQMPYQQDNNTFDAGSEIFIIRALDGLTDKIILKEK
jgi:ribose 5-phosphate isomerase RpiB